MDNAALVFFMLWGVWLITPILVDGVDAIARLVVVKRSKRSEGDRLPDETLPTVTVIVPAHNEAAVIDRCLTSVKAQDYPHEKLEVIVIDDGSTDGTADIAEEHAHEGPERSLVIRGQRISVGPFGGRFLVIRNGHAGKAHALNTGIAASDSELVINIDSDVVLAPQTVRLTAEAFIRDEHLGAATGDIEIDWELVQEHDHDGRPVTGDDGLPVGRKLTAWERTLSAAQFLEYLAAFRLGRQAQAVTGGMYTLAGAYSAIRRSALEKCRSYSNRTVSEDTDLTWELHRCGERIGFVPGARVLLEPCLRWDELYAQRVRWARGQLEVSALNDDLMRDRSTGRSERASLVKMLLLDHTLAFPRLLWAPLLLFFPLLGYPVALIALAMLGLYVLYVVIESMNTFAVFSIAEEDTRHRVERAGWSLFILPIYRFVVFYFRFSGFLVALTEEQQWTVPGHGARVHERFEIARLRSVHLLTSVARGSLYAWSWGLKAFATGVLPLALAATLVFEWMLAFLRRQS